MEENNQENSISLKDRIKVEPPKKYNVVLLNDNFTTKDFVVAILVKIFHYTIPSGEALMEVIHKTGRGVAGTYSKDIALTKKRSVDTLSKELGFPLRCEVEEA